MRVLVNKTDAGLPGLCGDGSIVRQASKHSPVTAEGHLHTFSSSFFGSGAILRSVPSS